MAETGEGGSGRESGKILYDGGDYAEAIPILLEHLASEPNDAKARAILAACYCKLGRNEEAIAEFTKLIQQEPGNARHFFNLGMAHQANGDDEKAKKLFERAVSLDPNHRLAQRQLAALSGGTQQAQEQTQESAAPPPPPPPPPTRAAGPPPAPEAPRRPIDEAEAEIPEAPRPTREARSTATAPGQKIVDTGGPLTTVPEGVNLGAFFLPFFWSIAHKAWLWAIISFFVLPVGAIVLLITGNKVAVENRKFASLAQFRAVQKAWLIWGIVVWAIGTLMFVAAMVSGVLTDIRMGQAIIEETNDGNFPGMVEMTPGNLRSMPSATGAQPGPGEAGDAVKVTPYKGAKRKGDLVKRTDEGGDYTLASFEVEADFESVFTFYKGLGEQSENFTASSSGNKATVDMQAASGRVIIDIVGVGENQTRFTIKRYKK